MKNLLYCSLFAATTLLNLSCTDNKGSNWEVPEQYSYATITKITESEMSDNEAEKDSVFFTLDNKETFVVTENKTNYDYKTLSAGKRLIAGVTLEDSYDEAFDYTAKLYELIGVTAGKTEIITTEDQNSKIKDDVLSYISTESSLTKGYLNLFIGFYTPAIQNVKFYLVENQLPDQSSGNSGNYLNLELRFNRAGADNMGFNYERYVSFDMKDFKERLEGKDGIVLRAKTIKSGGIVLNKIDSKDLFPAE